jgi:F420-dependent oxidoreductase-like protein
MHELTEIDVLIGEDRIGIVDVIPIGKPANGGSSHGAEATPAGRGRVVVVREDERPDAADGGVPVKLGFMIGYWGAGPPANVPELLAEAEALGFESAWTAEAYGSDALTPLAWWGSQTTRIQLGTSIIQMSARTPTATAMAAMTMDHLTNGRFILGLGASGPQVVEGWYGQPYPRPLERTREYVEIMRKIFARKEPLTYDGVQYKLPYPGGTGLGKAVKSIVHPLREDLPIYLAAEGPKNVALTAEIADGWLAIYYSPKVDDFYREALAEGFARPAARRTAVTFEVAATVPVIVHDDVEEAANFMRPVLALYIGGMGAREVNFHANVFARMGYEKEVRQIQDLYLEGKKEEAMKLVPQSLIEETSLIGPKEKIRDELARWEESAVTQILLYGDANTLRTMAELCL